jgi:hypothetical protein
MATSELPSAARLIEAAVAGGHKVFEGPYNLNLIALRAAPGRVNAFDDMLCVVFQREKGGAWFVEHYPCTTDPGLYWLQHPGRLAGTAALAEGQYRRGFTFGTHKGVYRCLVQNTPLRGYRDNNRDAVLDLSGPVVELPMGTGIQIHRASSAQPSVSVDKWSAGCMVLQAAQDLDRLLALCDAQGRAGYGSTFTLTLMRWSPGSDGAVAA